MRLNTIFTLFSLHTPPSQNRHGEYTHTHRQTQTHTPNYTHTHTRTRSKKPVPLEVLQKKALSFFLLFVMDSPSYQSFLNFWNLSNFQEFVKFLFYSHSILLVLEEDEDIKEDELFRDSKKD